MGAPTIAGLSVTVAFSSSAAVPSLGGEGKVSRGAWPALSPVLPRDSSSLGRHVNVSCFLHRPHACPDPAARAGSGREASHGLWSPSAALRLQPRSPGTMTSYASRRLTEGAPQLQGPSPTPPTCRLRGLLGGDTWKSSSGESPRFPHFSSTKPLLSSLGVSPLLLHSKRLFADQVGRGSGRDQPYFPPLAGTVAGAQTSVPQVSSSVLTSWRSPFSLITGSC